MKVGDTYQAFGCTWIVDEIYDTPKHMLMSKKNPFGLWHPRRYKAHVIQAPVGYDGVREMDAAYIG